MLILLGHRKDRIKSMLKTITRITAIVLLPLVWEKKEINDSFIFKMGTRGFTEF
jgi:hypothetical protein